MSEIKRYVWPTGTVDHTVDTPTGSVGVREDKGTRTVIVVTTNKSARHNSYPPAQYPLGQEPTEHTPTITRILEHMNA